jgi:hypothetical protein
LPHARASIAQYLAAFRKVDVRESRNQQGQQGWGRHQSRPIGISFEHAGTVAHAVDLNAGTVILPPSQAMLQQLPVKLSEFRVSIEAWWKDGEYHPHP